MTRITVALVRARLRRDASRTLGMVALKTAGLLVTAWVALWVMAWVADGISGVS